MDIKPSEVWFLQTVLHTLTAALQRRLVAEMSQLPDGETDRRLVPVLPVSPAFQKGERSHDFCQTAWQGASSPVHFQPVSEPLEIEIEDQSFLPSTRWEFTLFTHAHAATGGEVGTAGASPTSSKASQSQTFTLLRQKVVFASFFLRLSLFFRPLKEQLIHFLLCCRCSTSVQMMHRMQTSSVYIRATEVKN